MSLRRLGAVLALGLLAASCAATRPAPVTAPGDLRPRVFRSVLDGRPRMVTIDLGDDLWVSYDTRTASLYKVWRDGVALDGAVYDYRHGPQPRALGPAYVLRTGRMPWRLVIDGTRVRPQLQYRGHREEGRTTVLLSELRHGALAIPVEESVARAPGLEPGILWRLRAHDVPAGVVVEYEVDLDSLATAPRTDPPLVDVRRGPGTRLRGHLALAPGGETLVEAHFAAPKIAAGVTPEVDAGWTRLEASGCPSCHATEARTVGPALVEIAERYDADPGTVATLAAKLRAGGAGNWGATPMPAHDHLSAAEAADLVTLVLALDGDDAAAHRYAGARATDRTPALWELALEYGPELLGQWFVAQVENLFVPSDTAPGDGAPLAGVHPAFAVEPVAPEGFDPRVGGLDFFSNGDLAVATWDPEGAVHRLSGLDGEVRVQRLAAGLGEPLGLRVVDDEVFVVQKHELTRLVDLDGDGRADQYETVANDWGATGNFHEFAFGLVPDGDGFLATLSSGVAPGGNSATSQPIDRGAVVRIDRDGTVTPLARGLRTPNGIGRAYGGEIFVADNQGAWLPASKIVHVQPEAFYGFRDVDPEGDAAREETPPVAWLPQDEIGNSPSEPVPCEVGPYRGQILFGDVTHGGIKRLYVEEVDGALQGAVFRFTQGLAAGVNRLAWGPDGKLYVGGIGNPGNWGHAGHAWSGLERLTYTGGDAFEMRAVRSRPDGFEVEFTEPLATDAGTDPDAYRLRQWRYEPTAAYGGPKIDLAPLAVASVRLSDDRRTAHLAVDGLAPGSVVHIRLDRETIRARDGGRLWTTEAWYTLNRIPSAEPHFTADPSPVITGAWTSR